MKKTTETIGSRLGQFLNSQGVTFYRFQKDTGFPNGLIGKIVNKGSDFGTSKLEVILSCYPELNPIWLLTGRGNMLIENASQSPQSHNEGSSIDEPHAHVGYDRDDKQLQVLVVASSQENEKNIVLVPQEAEAGYPAGYKDPEFISKLPSFSLPGFNESTFRAFSIRGNSMESAIKTGDWVVGRYVPSLKEVQQGSICIIVLRNYGFVCKRVEKHFKNGLTLHSDNKDYQPIQPLAEDIIEVWEAKAIIRMI